MRKSMIRTGAEVMDKITGKELVVSSVEDGVGIAYPKDEDQTDGKRRHITEENCICFRFLRNPVKTTGIEAKIEDGALYVNGELQETGSLKPMDVIGVVPGKVIMTIESRTEGMADLMVYDVDRDRFSKLDDALPKDGLTHIIVEPGTEDKKEKSIAAVLKTETLTESDEDGTVVETGTDDVLYIISGDMQTDVECRATEFIDVDDINLTGGRHVYLLTRGHAIGKEDPFCEVWHYDEPEHDVYLAMSIRMEAKNISVSSQGIAVIGDDAIGIKFQGSTYLLESEGISSKMNPNHIPLVLVDVTVKGNTLTATFADHDTYETVTVQSVRTKDRGDIVTVL